MMRETDNSFDFDSFLTKMETGKAILKFHPKDEIFVQGSSANAVFYVRKGTVKLAVVSSRGKEAILGILEHDTFFGESCLAGEGYHSATAAAIEDCVIVRFTKDAMLRLIRRDPQFSYFFMSHLISRHVRIQEDLMDQLFNCSEKRLARALLLLAREGSPAPDPAIPPISQETLAEMVGTTRSRVSFFMNKFKKQGFLEYSGGWKINDSLRSVVLQD